MTRHWNVAFTFVFKMTLVGIQAYQSHNKRIIIAVNILHRYVIV